MLAWQNWLAVWVVEACFKSEMSGRASSVVAGVVTLALEVDPDRL